MKRAAALLFWLALSSPASAYQGWQKDLICQGCGNGKGCDPCSTVGNDRVYERVESAQERAERLARREKERREREEAAKARKIHGQRMKLSDAELASASRAALASATTPGDILTPGGSPAFQQGGAEPPPEVVYARAVGGVRTPASAIPLENLRRAAAVLGAAAQGLSTEDQAYLAREAAHAMDGDALRVAVPAGRLPSAEAAEATRGFAAEAQRFAVVDGAVASASAARVAAAKAYEQAAVAAYRSTTDRSEMELRSAEAKKAYDAAAMAEVAAKSAAKAAAGKLTYRVVP